MVPDGTDITDHEPVIPDIAVLSLKPFSEMLQAPRESYF
jgi:hypothetical protein